MNFGKGLKQRKRPKKRGPRREQSSTRETSCLAWPRAYITKRGFQGVVSRKEKNRKIREVKNRCSKKRATEKAKGDSGVPAANRPYEAFVDQNKGASKKKRKIQRKHSKEGETKKN